VDVAEVCRRRNGFIAQGLPEEIVIGEISCGSEVIPSEEGRDRTVSVLQIELDGIGEIPAKEEE
jgi:DNA-binding protein